MRTLAIATMSAVMLACTTGPMSPSDDAPAFARLAGADQGGQLFTTSLSGAEEAPGPGDPNGSGTFAMTINPGLGKLCYELSVENVDGTITGAHIHVAPAGSPGPIVVALATPVTGSSSGCLDVAAPLLLDLRKNPARYYVNVHSSIYPAGAVRGQLGD
jgi:hypothetical protein